MAKIKRYLCLMCGNKFECLTLSHADIDQERRRNPYLNLRQASCPRCKNIKLKEY
jgi:DNA-directed RNA polymerase subunit RPC12/RpoP